MDHAGPAGVVDRTSAPRSLARIGFAFVAKGIVIRRDDEFGRAAGEVVREEGKHLGTAAIDDRRQIGVEP